MSVRAAREPPILPVVAASGAAALLFETLWFRLSGLMLGNSLWASSLVLAGFMAGLAIGNGLSARLARFSRRPFLLYAGLESAVGLGGLAVVLVLPRATTWLIPALGPRLHTALALNSVRLVLAFLLMAAPATAMGATLPVLVRATTGTGEAFGTQLGRLYGWNTAGAVAGALAGELLLIQAVGLRGTAAVAAALNLSAALGALFIGRRFEAASAPAAPLARPRLGGRGLILVAAAAGCGAALLALEVVWFRFLRLMVHGTALMFAVMLAVVLSGIAAGGVIAGVWCRRHAHAAAYVGSVAFAAGAVLIASYATFSHPSGWVVWDVWGVGALAARLMLPVCVLSGVMFVLLGAALQDQVAEPTWAAGVTTLANTLGAAAGSLAAGFVLLPRLGIEGALLVLALSYGMIGVALFRPRPAAAALGAAALATALFLFPSGLTERTIRQHVEPYAQDGSRVVAVREGWVDTVVYTRRDLWGMPYYYRLVSDSVSLSGTMTSRRYMKLFAYLPGALRPDARSALLVCFGLGNTAQALSYLGELRSLDVVDISPDVLELSGAIYPVAAATLADPRVHVHVEDGRFFLQATDRNFDIITAEPPPPKSSGVVNLYSREYFALVRDHLVAGGVTTHWLPVHQLLASDARAIVAGFCSVFPDCSLWAGSGYDWILMGTRDLDRAPGEAAFARSFDREPAKSDLAAIGLERPEQLGATFLGDAEFLRTFAAGAPPLEDDHPLRLSSRASKLIDPSFAPIMDVSTTRERFAASAWIGRFWPAGLRQRSLEMFWTQDPLAGGTKRLDALRRVLSETPLVSLPERLLESNPDEVALAERAAARGEPDPMVAYIRGIGALAARDFTRADALFADAQARRADVKDIEQARAFVRELLAAGSATAGRPR